jgi:hypothetical protein
VGRDNALGGIADWVRWTGEDYAAYTDPAGDTSRTLGAGAVEFEVRVANVVDVHKFAWPTTPVETTTFTTTQEAF